MATRWRKTVVATSLAVIIVLSAIVVTRPEPYDPPLDFCGTRAPMEIIILPTGTDSRRSNNTTTWNAWFECTSIRGSSEDLNWTSIGVYIEIINHPVFATNLVPLPDTIPELPYLKGYYRDLAGDPHHLDVGDELCLSNLNRSQQGMKVQIFTRQGWSRIDSFIPTFEDPYWLNMAVLNVTIPWKGATIWDVMFIIVRVQPEWEQVPWTYISTRELIRRPYSPDRYEICPVRPISSLGEGRGAALSGYYEDSGKDDGIISVGDRLLVSGDWSDHVGRNMAPLCTGNSTIAYMDVYDLPDVQVRLEISEPRLIHRNLSANETVWDCEFTIEGMEPKEGVLAWGRPEAMFDSVHSALIVHRWAAEDDGSYPTSTKVYFREVEPVDGYVDVGDVIVVKRMTKEFEWIPLKMGLPYVTITLIMPLDFETGDTGFS